MRPIGFILRGNSPALIVRESLWRIRKQWAKKRFRIEMGRLDWPVSLRHLSYYRPDVREVSPEATSAIVGFADLICQGQFAFLGYEARLGFPPNWNVDFVSGKDWPLVRSDVVSPVRDDGGDVKVPWELSRLQCLPVLGKAYALTNREEYRSAAMTLLSDWIDHNPPGIGVNWTVPMEAALRSMSVCFLLSLIDPARAADTEWLQKAVVSLWQHLLFIESHIEFSHLMRGNHYLANIVGLFCISLFLEGQGMQSRREVYCRKVEEEILCQVYEDGGNHEASTGYHVFTTQLFATARLLMRAEGILPQASFVSRLRGMFGWLGTIANCYGRLPQIGDCDDGRVELTFDDLSQIVNLPIAGRDSLRQPNFVNLSDALLGDALESESEDAPWYGIKKPRMQPTPGGCTSPRPAVNVLPQSGIVIGRNGPAEVVFCAIPNGINGKGSHTHNDKLSIVLHVGGEELLCDSGTLFYTRNAALRNSFRSTHAHNTVVVDGCEQNTLSAFPTHLFCLGNEATVSLIDASQREGCVFLKASHFGYRRIGVIHSRSLVLTATYLQITDDFMGTGKHRFHSSLHLPSPWGVTPRNINGSAFTLQRDGSGGAVIAFEAPTNMHAEVEPIRISRTYGATSPGTRISVFFESMLPISMSACIRWN